MRTNSDLLLEMISKKYPFVKIDTKYVTISEQVDNLQVEIEFYLMGRYYKLRRYIYDFTHMGQLEEMAELIIKEIEKEEYEARKKLQRI